MAGETRTIATTSAAPPPVLITALDSFWRVLAETEREPVVGLDTETTGLDPHVHGVRTVQIATAGAAWVVDAWSVGDVGALRAWLAQRARAGRRTVLHNAKFDLKTLRAALGGSPLAEVAVSDVMLWSQVLACGLSTPGGHGLAALAARWLGMELPKAERLESWTGELRPEQVGYAGRDAWVLVPLAGLMRDRLSTDGLVHVADVEDACAPIVADMEYDGIALDLTCWRGLTEDLRSARAAAQAEVLRFLEPPQAAVAVPLFGEREPALNLDSPRQVLGALRGIGLEVASTAEPALKPLAPRHPAVAALLAYKRAAKLLSGFGEALPGHVHRKTGRIHPEYHQITGAGRMSCSSPNVQQIPHEARFRRAFVAPPGKRLVIADLSQIELRIMAKLSGDARMLEAYRRGEDLHRLTASLVAGVPLEAVTREQRQLAKAVNFGLIYGMSAGGLRAYAANTYGVPMAAAEAETFRQRFFEAYAGVAAYHRRQDTEARKVREARTLLGRCRRWPDTDMGLPELANTPDQGTGADILKRAMAAARPALLAASASLVASVHDELVVECPEDRAAEVAESVRAALVAGGADLLDPVPVEAEVAIGKTWADKT